MFYFVIIVAKLHERCNSLQFINYLFTTTAKHYINDKMGKYKNQLDRNYYLKNWMKLKIQRANKMAGQKGHFIIKQVISLPNVHLCLTNRPPDSRMAKLQGSRRMWDQVGSLRFTDLVRSIPLNYRRSAKGDGAVQPQNTVGEEALQLESTDGTDKVVVEPEKTFGDVYKLVAEVLGMGNSYSINDNDRLIVHKEMLQVIKTRILLLKINCLSLFVFGFQQLQSYHIDANEDDITTIDGKTIKGYGKGFSAFLGLSDINTMWVAEISSTENKIVNEQRLTFGAGDVLILKYGTLHRGDSNMATSARHKLFTNVCSHKTPDSFAQLWYIEGANGGWTSIKPS